MRSPMSSGPMRWAAVLLIAQAALLYSSIHPESIPPSTPLARMPASLGPWQQVGPDGVVEQEIMDVLQADDLLNREFEKPDGTKTNLFIAAFRSQRNGKAPHSPKNCLPGSGWSPLLEEETSIDVGQAVPIPVNRYIVAHGQQRALVMYWYQSRDRVVANEYKAKFWVVADSMRYNRTDTALVRVIVNMPDQNDDAAAQTAIEFIRAFYPAIREVLPH